MMGSKVSQLNTYFEKKLTECAGQKAALSAEDRRDEANFCQIRANIYDIFRTILSVAERTQNTDEDVAGFFTKKLREMKNTWAESGKKAAEHGDDSKAAIEQIKVETAEEIRQVFEETWGENNDGSGSHKIV